MLDELLTECELMLKVILEDMVDQLWFGMGKGRKLSHIRFVVL